MNLCSKIPILTILMTHLVKADISDDNLNPCNMMGNVGIFNSTIQILVIIILILLIVWLIQKLGGKK